ncbi:Hin recombinase [Klebsiella pneumoniae]|nr:Hin recombinase [Klebsiella pneumoniae]MBZ7543389.1 Hin recombinase [Klebsiella pneumoniae]
MAESICVSLAAAREQGRVGGRRRVMTTEVVERCRRMLENGATRQQIADVTGVGVKTIYKYFPAAVRDQGFLPFP